MPLQIEELFFRHICVAVNRKAVTHAAAAVNRRLRTHLRRPDGGKQALDLHLPLAPDGAASASGIVVEEGRGALYVKVFP